MTTRWICTVCNYVHEGPEPPERCPVCDAPREQFVPLPEEGSSNRVASDAPDVPPTTMEEVRDRARERLRGVCAVYPACDGAAGNLCNREAYGAKIGLGGVGTGASFAANVASIARHRLRTRVVGSHFTPDTRIRFLGQELALPVLGSSTAGFGGYSVMEERDFCRAAVRGCLGAGTLSLRGDTEHYDLERHAAVETIAEAGGRGIPIFKPRRQDDLKRLVGRAVEAGCVAVGLDCDGFGSTNMARAGQPVFRKSQAEIRELAALAGIPFVVKGIMDPDDAEACAEAGARVVAVSNHGGRVLDRTPGVAEVLPGIVERLGGRVTITADGGVRTGFDVLTLLALGADAVLIGRDLIRAAIGGGALGVQLHLEHLQRTLGRAMLMTGCPTVEDVGPGILC